MTPSAGHPSLADWLDIDTSNILQTTRSNKIQHFYTF